MGYLVKVDTNGSKPTILERLIRGRWVDYLAMDVKGPSINMDKLQKPMLKPLRSGEA